MKLDAAQRSSQSQFDKQSRCYGHSHILSDVSDLERLFDQPPIASVSTRGRALDVAAGGGHTSVFLAVRGWDVTACDISSEMLSRTKELGAARGLKISTCQHAAEALPYEDATFSIVTCRVAAHHFTNTHAFLKEVSRVLRPGGYFVLIDGSIPDGNPEAEEWMHKVEKLRDPSHGKFLSPAAWKSLCHGAGLRVLSCQVADFKQPDIAWYFETAATSQENRAQVLDLISKAPESARLAFRLTEADGKTVWWWLRMELVAEKAVVETDA